MIFSFILTKIQFSLKKILQFLWQNWGYRIVLWMTFHRSFKTKPLFPLNLTIIAVDRFKNVDAEYTRKSISNEMKRRKEERRNYKNGFVLFSCLSDYFFLLVRLFICLFTVWKLYKFLFWKKGEHRNPFSIWSSMTFKFVLLMVIIINIIELIKISNRMQ